MYIGVPIVSIYLLILYVYSAKILVTGDWPEGQVVWLMLVFILAGFVVTFLSFPLQFLEKSKVYMYMQRGFFVALFPLMIVYFMALSIRVGEYGWTDNRYIVAAFGVWIILCSLVYLFRRSDIRWFFGLFAIIALISVAVPGIRMFDVSVASQKARLYEFFEENDMIKDGKIVSHDETVHVQYAIGSIFHYLDNRGALDQIAQQLDEPLGPEELEGWDLEDAVLRALNIQTYNRYDEPVHDNIQILEIQQRDKEIAYDIAGYSQMLRFDSWNGVFLRSSPKAPDEQADYQILVIDEQLSKQIHIGDILIEASTQVDQPHEYI